MPSSYAKTMYLKLAMIMAGLFVAGQAMGQGVRWEDYRGNQNVAPNANYIGPAGAPTFVNYPNSGAIAALRAVSANSANAVRTGTSATIDFASGAVDSLCDNRNNTSSTPCLYQAQGKVAYALVQFPQAGTYSIAAAHDDNVVIELSPDFTNTNYRTASYSILAGQVTDWSSSETDFQTFGTFTAANANSCALLRMYWNNQNGLNFNHLRWTTPGGTTQIIPAANLKDPASISSATGCNGSINGNVAGITLNKVIGSPRINAADQFTIEIGTTAGAGTVATATTTGSGAGQQASTSFATTTGTTYHVREVMASGTSAITDYTQAISCTRNGTAFTPSPEGNANQRRWSLGSAGATDQVICTITNTAPTVKPTVTVNKISVGGTGTFSFTGSNGIANHNITTTADSVPATGATYTLTTAGTATTITESAPSGSFVLQGISCSGLGTGGTATPDLSTRTVTLDVKATANGSAIVCTFTNTNYIDLSISKTTTTNPVISGKPVSYTITVANAGPATATGAVVKDIPLNGITCPPANTVTCSGTACPSASFPFGNLLSGVTMGAMAVGSSATLTFSCNAN